MKTIKIISLVFLILLGVLGFSSLLLGGFMPLFAIAFGILFLYYLLIHILFNILYKRKKKRYFYIVFVCFLIPIILMIIDFEGAIDFLLQGIELDMK